MSRSAVAAFGAVTLVFLIHSGTPSAECSSTGASTCTARPSWTTTSNAADAKPEWDEIFDRWGIQTVLLPKDSPLAAVLRADPHWQRLFAGDIEEVFGRAGGSPPPEGGALVTMRHYRNLGNR